MKKNVWILNHYAGPPEITTGVRHYKFAENLIKNGYKALVFCASSIHGKNENVINDKSRYIYKEFNGVPFVFISARNCIGNGLKRILNMFDYFFGVLKVSKKYNNMKPDVIIASSVHPLTWVAGYMLSKRYNAEFIAETRDLWPETLIKMNKISSKNIFAKVMYGLERFIYNRADKLIFTMPGYKDYMNKRNYDIDKAFYINNGVDVDEYNYNKVNYRTNIVKNINKFTVVYTGSMGIANALDYILDAAIILSDRGVENIEFVLVGNGYEKERLKSIVKNNNINNVRIFDSVEKKFIPSILAISDLNIFTGQSIDLYDYGLSLNKMFDYMASGKPTLSNIKCNYDILLDEKCGLTVDSDSATSIAEGIIKFYRMPEEEYKKYCDNAVKAAAKYDFKNLTKKLIYHLLPMKG